MATHRRTARRGPILPGILGAGVVLVVGALLAPDANAATLAATASVDVHAHYVGETGKDFTFTVNNTGTSDNIAAVLISRPSSKWTITACPQAPAGWTAALASTVSDVKCRYTSAAGTADDILPAGSSSSFVVRANSAPGAADATGTWVVSVSKNGLWGSTDATRATAAGTGLGTTAHVWEIISAVVSLSAPSSGLPCPSGVKEANAGSTQLIVICGRNHANTALTPAPGQSSLGGTFIQSAGSFTSAYPIVANSPPVVLGHWTGATITSDAGPGKTVVVTTGSSPTATSPVTTFTGYTAIGTSAAPVLANVEGAALGYTENGPAVPITGTLTVTDADSANLASATVTISTGYQNGQDVLALASPPAGIAANFDAATGVLTLSGSSSVADYEAALRGVTYVNTSDTPATGTRTVGFQVNDGVSGSNVVTRDINVTAANDAPTITLSGSTPTFTEEGTPVAVDSGIVVADPDDSDLVSGSVTVSAGLQPGDLLAFTPAGGISDTNAAPDVLALSGTTSVANWQSVLQSVTFSTTSQNPGTSRTISFTVNDGDVNSATANKSVTVVSVNDAPVVTTSGGSLAYLENAGATAVDTGVTVADTDSTNLVGAKVQIIGGYVNGEDVLSLGTNPQSGITAAPFDTATGTLTLTGSSSVANYQTALRDVRYANTSNDPSTGTRTVSFQVDDGGAANNLSNVATRTVGVTRVNDAPVGVADAFDALGNTRLVVGIAGTGGPHVETAGSITSNDTDVDTPQASLDALPATSSSANCAGCNNVTVNANGSFTYDPPPGFTGNDTFTYTVRDNDTGDTPSPAQTATGTVTVTVQGPVVWYVDATPDVGQTGNKGLSHAPFTSTTSLQPSNGSVDDVNEIIFVYSGTYTAANGLALQNGQRLLGEPFGLTVDPAGSLPSQNLVAAGGTNPELRATGTNVAGITLANGVEIQRVNASNSSAGCTTCAGVRGTGVTTATIGANTQISGNSGPGVLLSGAAGGNVTVGSQISGNNGLAVSVANRTSGTVAFEGTVSGTSGGVSLSNNGGATISFPAGGMNLATDASPAFTVVGGGVVNVSGTGNALSTTTGTTVDISGASGDSITIDATVTQNGATASGKAVSVAGHTGGTVAFPKAVSSTNGGGISLTTNTNTTMNFTGGVTLSTAGNPAFTATGGGTVNVTGSANTITTTTGTGVNVTTTIGGSGLTFRSINVNGAANGIVLSNTGAGAFVVAGNGGNCTVADPTCTGGTIQNTTGTGVALTNTTGVSLTRMRILDAGGHGVSGTGVSSFTFASGINQGSGNGNDEDAFSFGTLGSTNITGTLSITNSAVRKFAENGLLVRNTTGALAVTITNTTFQDNNQEDGVPGSGANGLLVEGSGSAGITLNVSGSTFDEIESAAIQYEAEGSGTNDVNIIGNTFSHPSSITNFEVGGGVTLITDTNASGNPAELTFDVQGNYFNLVSGAAVLVVGEGNADGRIGGDTPANPNGPGTVNQGNTIKQAGSLNGCAEDAIRLDDDGNFHAGLAPVTTWRILVKNNSIDAHNGVDSGGGDLCSGASGDQGITVFVRDSAGTFHGTFTSNTVTDPLNQGMRVFVADRDAADGVSNGPNVFLTVNNNSFANVGAAEGISMSVDDQADLCANVTGNTVDGNIFLERRVATATFLVPQASTGAISAANGGAPVTLGAQPLTFNTNCNVALPTNP